MKKLSIFFVLVIIIFCRVSVFAQNGIMFEGKVRCKVVINFLQELHGNDSIAVDIFKSGCKIINMSGECHDLLLKQNYIKIIQYFNSKEGEKYFCRSKVMIRRDYSLLDDR